MTTRRTPADVLGPEHAISRREALRLYSAAGAQLLGRPAMSPLPRPPTSSSTGPTRSPVPRTTSSTSPPLSPSSAATSSTAASETRARAGLPPPYVVELGAAQFAGLQLSRLRRELITLATARRAKSEYEWVQHVAPARAAGATDEQLAALDRGELTAPCFDEADQALLAFAVAVVDRPSVPDPIFEAARRHVDDRQLVEIVGLVGYYGMTARICTVFGSRQPQQVERAPTTLFT
ncbi:carboxymuconolactone decarboxylase family protein [Streptomyces sp. NPDC002814]